MQYLYYEEDIVIKEGVDLIGWTQDRFVNPSELSSSVSVLTELRDVLKDGTCKWVKLTAVERKARKAAWVTAVAAGKVIQRVRSARSDIGKKRKRHELEGEEDEDEDDRDDDNNGLSPPDDAHASPANDNVHIGPSTSTTPATATITTTTHATADATASAPVARRPRKKAKDTKEIAARSKASGKAAAEKAAMAPAKSSGAKVLRTKKDKENRKPRDDEVTRGVLAKMKADCRKATSRAIISDDEDNDAAPTPAIPSIPTADDAASPTTADDTTPAATANDTAVTAVDAMVIDPALL